jgi:hypothetical protein
MDEAATLTSSQRFAGKRQAAIVLERTPRTVVVVAP